MTVATATAVWEIARDSFVRASADLRAAVDAESRALLGVDALPANVRRVVEMVSEQTGVPVGDILGRSKRREVADARALAMALTRESTPHTIITLGEIFRREHSTISHATQAVDHHAATEPGFARLLAGLRAALEIPAPRP